MGTTVTRIKSPYELLNCSPLDSLSTITQSYLKAIKMHTNEIFIVNQNFEQVLNLSKFKYISNSITNQLQSKNNTYLTQKTINQFQSQTNTQSFFHKMKKHFKNLFISSQYNNDLHSAYTKILTSSPPLILYTPSKIPGNEDIIIEKINFFCNIKLPLYSSTEYDKLYRMIDGFKVDGKLFRNEEDRIFFIFSVFRIFRFIKKRDKRLSECERINGNNDKICNRVLHHDRFCESEENVKCMEEVCIDKKSMSSVCEDEIIHDNVVNNKLINDNLINEKNIKYDFKCIDCNRTFLNENSLKNHLRSKKHSKNNQIILDDNSRESIIFNRKNSLNKENGNVGDLNEIEKGIKVATSENESLCNKPSSDKFHNINIANNKEKQEHTFKKDNLVFRTCNKCKMVFDTRVLLLFHIREKHKQM